MTEAAAIAAGKNPSEVLFEEVLRSAGFADFAFEPEVEGTSRRPDYGVQWEGKTVFFEVKEFRADTNDAQTGFGHFDPYGPVREKIDAGRKKFKDIEGHCCCLVLHNVDKPLIFLDWEHVYAAMLGDLGFSLPINVRNRESPRDTAATKIFTSGGKMHREREGVPIDAQNRTISAVLVIGHFPAGQNRFAAHIRKLEEERGFTLDIEAVLDEAEAASGTEHDPSIRQLRVVVHENPYARIPFPDELFRGEWDERYGGREGRIQRLFQGGQVARFEGGS